VTQEFERKFKHVTKALLAAVTHVAIMIYFVERLYSIGSFSKYEIGDLTPQLSIEVVDYLKVQVKDKEDYYMGSKMLLLFSSRQEDLDFAYLKILNQEKILYYINLNLYCYAISIMYKLFQIFISVQSCLNHRKLTILGILTWTTCTFLIIVLQVRAVIILWGKQSYDIARTDRFYLQYFLLTNSMIQVRIIFLSIPIFMFGNGFVFFLYRYYKTRTFDFIGFNEAVFEWFGVRRIVFQRSSRRNKLREKKLRTVSILNYMKETRRKY